MGTLLIIEGVDGSGKQTQTQRLYERLVKEGKKVISQSFPNYKSDSSAPVKMYLEGMFGDKPEDVDAYAASVLFAVDRFATYRSELKKYYDDGYIILCDRYTTSNIVHQASKIDDASEKDRFVNWLADFEYNLMGIPKPDVVFFLDTSADHAIKLISERKNKITNDEKKDIHESDDEYLIKSYYSAVELAKKLDWTIISCMDGENMRSIEDISNEIYDKLVRVIEG